MTSFFGELRRRNVVKVAVAYAIVGWLLVEITSTVLPTFEAPQWVLQTITFVVILGFPLALILSWAYELTPEGIKLERDVAAGESITRVTGRKIDFAIIGALVLALGFVVYNYVLEDGELATGVLPNSVAVLLCDNLSPDPDDAYFAASIHEEILNQLVKLRNLNVIARTSVLQYADAPPSIPQIAEELNVETVMECSVRYAGDAILVTAQLIDPETNSHLWSDTYPGDLSDLSTVFAMQADIAMNIANALAAEFSLEEQARIEKVPTENPEAYDLYLRAGQIRGAVGLAYLDQAIDLDPDFAEAYARRANINVGGITIDLRAGETLIDRVEQEALVRQDLEKALTLDPSIGSAYANLGFLHQINWRGVEAQAVYERAFQLLPNDVAVLNRYALFKAWIDQPEEAISLAKQAVELDPNNIGSLRSLGTVYEYVGNLDEASDVFHELRSIIPNNLNAQNSLTRIEVALGDSAEAEKEMRLLEPMVLNGSVTPQLAVLAYGYARLGLYEDAARAFAELEEREGDRTIASASRVLVNLARGDDEQALYWLNRIAEEREAYLGQRLVMRIKANVFRDPTLDKPEFIELREQLGFTDL